MDCPDEDVEYVAPPRIADADRLHFSWNFHRDDAGSSASARREYMSQIVPPAIVALMK